MNVMQLGKKKIYIYVFLYELKKNSFFFTKRFFGPTGRGTEEHFGMIGKIDIINSTLGKALGGAAGGYTTGPKALIDLLRQRSRPYLFSNTLPPFVN
jgi:7-keto-8-aminopelargonate synthetase-like enzyme